MNLHRLTLITLGLSRLALCSTSGKRRVEGDQSSSSNSRLPRKRAKGKERYISSPSHTSSSPFVADVAHSRDLLDMQTRAEPLSLADYHIIENGVLGEGNAGKVFAAIEKATGKKVALKVLKSRLISARTEVEVMNSIDHPFAARCLGTFQLGMPQDGLHEVIVVEYISQTSLKDIIKRARDMGGRIHPGLVARFTAQILTILNYLHSADIGYYDLHPANLMIDRDDIRLIDFGSSMMGGFPTGGMIRSTCTLFSDPAADLKNPIPVLPRRNSYGMAVDYYAVASTLYAMVTGTYPAAKQPLVTEFADVNQIIAILTESDHEKRWNNCFKDFRNTFFPLPFFQCDLVNWSVAEFYLDNTASNFPNHDLASFDEINFEQPLGEGREAKVYAAILRQSGQAVALKIYDPLTWEDNAFEARILRYLNHPNIVKFVAEFDECIPVKYAKERNTQYDQPPIPAPVQDVDLMQYLLSKDNTPEPEAVEAQVLHESVHGGDEILELPDEPEQLIMEGVQADQEGAATEAHGQESENEDEIEPSAAKSKLDELLSGLSHPYEEEEMVDILVMERPEGITIEQYIQQHGHASIPTISTVAAQLLSALNHMHAHLVAHLSLTPSDIIINPATNHVTIIDFGNAHFGIGPMSGIRDLPRIDNPFSEPITIHPDGRYRYGWTTDYYSLGGILYYMATGHPPCPDGMTGVFPPVSNSDLNQLLLLLTCPAPEARYGQIYENFSDIKRLPLFKDVHVIMDS